MSDGVVLPKDLAPPRADSSSLVRSPRASHIAQAVEHVHSMEERIAQLEKENAALRTGGALAQQNADRFEALFKESKAEADHYMTFATNILARLHNVKVIIGDLTDVELVRLRREDAAEAQAEAQATD